MAHRFWDLNEIVRATVAILVSDKARASAVALASCSKILEEPALDEVWRSLSSLAPLVKSFPSDVWGVDSNNKLVFKRVPLRAEWTRFQQWYAPRVQHLEISSPNAVISSTTLHMFQLYSPGSPVLPNLLSLEWESDDAFLLFVSPFISRPLTSIVVKSATRSLTLPPILTSLSTLSPYIREIDIEHLHHDASTEEASSRLLMQCDYRLRRYNVDSPISASAFKHMIQLPSLEVVCLIIYSSQLPDPLPLVVFPSLREIDVAYEGDPTWLKLLAGIKNPVLNCIAVECPRSDAANFMRTFQLTMTGCGIHERLEGFGLRSPDGFKITPQIIAYSLSFKNLTHFHVLSECSVSCQTFDLKDDDIDQLTNAMPCLESLVIGAEPCTTPSQITFKSLYTISRRCTRLLQLQIHFNPALLISKVIESEDVALGLLDRSPSCDLGSATLINVGRTPLPLHSDTIYIMALGLLGVFPRLERLEYNDGNRNWKQVDDLIQVCQRMGHFAFGKG